MDISNLAKPARERGEGRGRGRLGETLSMSMEQGPGSSLCSTRASVRWGRNPALNMRREIHVQQEFQLVPNASTGWVCSQGCGAESAELNMG